ncbi:hypothetical protein KORDIASMS9_02507 [Kordia sp. SMS9]|uniref:hypothetical protein n=1 Tax=Kordia sp. SMS9 TaxID=2282170 RepID=UPI000E10E080|nr:hypothetical protein [Kordia sp. SMS9]AXG70268.1 hypothetical protein KORDIASMS9_02507 [Kordia sp. SMS9]
MKKLQLKKLVLHLRTISKFESLHIHGGHPTEEPSEGAQCASDDCGPKSKTKNN